MDYTPTRLAVPPGVAVTLTAMEGLREKIETMLAEAYNMGKAHAKTPELSNGFKRDETAMLLEAQKENDCLRNMVRGYQARLAHAHEALLGAELGMRRRAIKEALQWL